MTNSVQQYRKGKRSVPVIQSVERAAQILKALGAGTPRLGITELSERVGLAKPTVHGLLRTLEAQELVEQDPETGKYRLGPALLQLGNAYLDNHELRARSLVWAESLADRANEAVKVVVLHGASVLVVHHVFRPDNSVQMLEVGAAIPWHACALGKAIVANLGDEQRGAMLSPSLPALTGSTITASSAMGKELQKVARAGFAVEDQEAIVGEAGIAAAVFDGRGVGGAIGVTGPVERLLPKGPGSSMIVLVREAARALSRDLGAGRMRSRST
jgi:DNA-binding IclR family transcriptional regulator